jgi:hypothetical protein
MTINSDRYLNFMLGSAISLPVWIIALSFFYIDIEYLWIIIIITALIILFFIISLLLYLLELLNPHEYDVIKEFFFPAEPFSIAKYIIITFLTFVLGYMLWIIKSHIKSLVGPSINYHTKKYTGYEFLGGKRKGYTHRKN